MHRSKFGGDSIGIIRDLGDSTQSGCCLSDVVAADASLPQFLRESPEDDPDGESRRSWPLK